MNSFFKKFITVTRGSADFFRSREVLPPSIREVERPSAERPGVDFASVVAESRDNKTLKQVQGNGHAETTDEASSKIDSSGIPQNDKGGVGDDGDRDNGTDSKSGSKSALGRVGTGAAAQGQIASDSLICPYCASKNYTKRGFRQKKLERVQLMICNDCGKTFTPHLVKGKHYPLATIFDAISLYNLGFSLEESCRRCRPSADIDTEVANVPAGDKGTRDTLNGKGNVGIGASTLSNWIHEFSDRMPFLRMRDFAIQKYTPFNMVTTATLAHRQLYKFRFHHAKCELIMQENFHHKTFQPLKEFLELVNSECPHQYFSAKNDEVGIMRASELNTRVKSPLTFSKTAMIVRGKRNYATMMAEFVLQSVKDRTKRHEALQKYFLYNDSVTIATEVPVYLTRDDLEHMQSQLGFEVYRPSARPSAERPSADIDTEVAIVANTSNVIPEYSSGIQKDETGSPIGVRDDGSKDETSGGDDSKERFNTGTGAVALPRLVTGHIDFLQIRNGMVHILDYKPNAEKEKPIEQLTLYAMALSRLTGLRLFEFKCAWFDEKDYFEFYPLHVLHKPKKARRRKKVETQEGTYLVNKDDKKIKSLRPI